MFKDVKELKKSEWLIQKYLKENRTPGLFDQFKMVDELEAIYHMARTSLNEDENKRAKAMLSDVKEIAGNRPELFLGAVRYTFNFLIEKEFKPEMFIPIEGELRSEMFV